jgi:import receptor subunit TOM70
MINIPAIHCHTQKLTSSQDRKELASKIKAQGNKAYGSKDYNRAIELYTKAIEVKQDPIYYSNRAACHQALGDWDKVIEDTTAAINLNAMYVKALNRRANAYEQIEKYSDALLDYTASCIIDRFSETKIQAKVENLLQIVAEQKAKEVLAKREKKKLPSVAFVGNFLGSFRPTPLPAGLEETEDLTKDSGLGQLRESLIKMQHRGAEEYNDAYKAVEKSIELGDLGNHEALAYHVRATFRWLIGDVKEAFEDINKSIELDPTLVRSYILRASMHLENSMSYSSAHNMTNKTQKISLKFRTISNELSSSLLMTQTYTTIEPSSNSFHLNLTERLWTIRSPLTWIQTLYFHISNLVLRNTSKASLSLQTQHSTRLSKSSQMFRMFITIMENYC